MDGSAWHLGIGYLFTQPFGVTPASRLLLKNIIIMSMRRGATTAATLKMMSTGKEPPADGPALFEKLGGIGIVGESIERLVPQNWARNVKYTAVRFHAPESVEELASIVRDAEEVRVIGTRHSFSTVADTVSDMITLDHMPPVLEIDEAKRTVTVSAATTCAELAEGLEEQGWALHNLPSMPHISVMGALATGTHGSGDTTGSLLAALVDAEYVDADGSIVCSDCGALPSSTLGSTVNLDMQGHVLGGIGVIFELTLAIEPSYDVRVDVYTALPWARLEEQWGINRLFAEAYSVSDACLTDAQCIAALVPPWYRLGTALVPPWGTLHTQCHTLSTPHLTLSL